MSVTNAELARDLPKLQDILVRIASGELNVLGGVVRYAAGTGKGGQIAAHLVFPSDPQQAQQSISQLQATMQQRMGNLQGGMDVLQQSMGSLQALQMANLAMAGLNLAVTTAGFVIVCKKLNKISGQIEAQSAGIAQTLQMVSEAHEHSLLMDEARFRGLVLACEQHFEEDDIELLKHKIQDFHEQYQFTKLVLQRHAVKAASNVDRLIDIQVLQDRLVNLGLFLAQVQIKVGARKRGQETLQNLAQDLDELNGNRVKALISDRDLSFRITEDQLGHVVSFIESGKQTIPALTYQADLLGVEHFDIDAVNDASMAGDIVVIAA
ncbi:hypothetical protein [Stenotrophomonas maltophilia]|uniref:Uncharacterized protein n=1 Tax=Stenotrophomonas maltophilia TaxID=40324 RepID=A0AAI9BZQ6_STEMA|nr:hypothetical protein [Stenotrophomonas maltophilia]EKT4091679.1 hypothetical protein [Stenotrophomonas maltophilia]MBA0363059.1 hypothetical protein [Stenotrophomonas maltophilia]HEL5044600.1 hypothetical protein [Stenotrophomonas maltophilia]